MNNASEGPSGLVYCNVVDWTHAKMMGGMRKLAVVLAFVCMSPAPLLLEARRILLWVRRTNLNAIFLEAPSLRWARTVLIR